MSEPGMNHLEWILLAEKTEAFLAADRRDKKDSSGIVILLAVIVVLAGILTTATIIKRYAGTLPMPRRRIDEARA